MNAGFRLDCEVAFDDDDAGGAAEVAPPPRAVETLVAVTLFEAGAPAQDIEVGVTFCSAQRIRELNAQHRQVDAPTDVLAFPIDGLLEDVPAGMPRQLGDVVICTAYVGEQLAQGATMAPHGPGQEQGDATLEAALERCIVHGVLHLAGFDHERGERDAQEMFALEQLVLDRFRSAARREA